ncbi:hypothetical protein DL93DRAFT_2079442 [Clavulina sp. PMI_390]|nr:hypothetical protein DL93DRAFT_2079442 [Clavulina sp. PMI_390]
MLTYRVSRFGDAFVLFEEYADLAAVAMHRATVPYLAYTEAQQTGLIIKREVGFYKDI